MRRTLSNLIDDVTTRLGDGAQVASRAEILDWLCDGYSRMVREAQSPATLEAHDVPPQVEYACTYEWERDYIQGTTRKFTYTHDSGRYECTYLHEVGREGSSQGNVTHLHMLEYVSDTTDNAYRFTLPRRHELLMLWYDHRLLLPATEKELQLSDWNVAGLPTHYSTDEYDIYRIVTTNYGAYETDRAIGIPRAISGDRTYEIDSRGEDGIGVIRSISSADRQYHNSTPWQRYGTIRHWGSTVDNLAVYSVVVPPRELSEADSLHLIPPQLEKYVKYWALAQIHNRPGELYEPNMAEHYRMRWRRGPQLLSRIRNVAYRDASYGRDVRSGRPRTARPMLPDNYPALRWRG